MRTKTLTKLPYEAPDTSVDVIQTEQCILSAGTQQMEDFDENEIYDEDF